jgi:hypothetical protein
VASSLHVFQLNSTLWEFRFSRRQIWRWQPSGILRRVVRALMMVAERASETSVNFYQTARRNVPKGSHLQNFTNFSHFCMRSECLLHASFWFEECKLWSFVFLLRYVVFSSQLLHCLLRSNTLSTVFSNILNVTYVLNLGWETKFHSHEEMGKIIVFIFHLKFDNDGRKEAWGGGGGGEYTPAKHIILRPISLFLRLKWFACLEF